MTIIPPSEPKVSNWQQLSYFRVFVENDAHLQNARYPILNNKRQQLLVTVRLAAKDASGNPAIIPQSDLNNIRLMDYNTSALIDFTNDFSGQWTTSRLNQGYIWDRGFLDSIRTLRLEQPQLFTNEERRAGVAEPLELNLPLQIQKQLEDIDSNAVSLPDTETTVDCPNGYQCIQFLVSTGARAMRRLAARIVNSDGTTFRTNYSEVSDDLGEGDRRGKFNSSFEVEPVSFPFLPNENYGDRKLDGSGVLRDTLASSASWFGNTFRAFEQHINIRMPGGRKVPIKTVIHKHGNAPHIGDMLWACRGSAEGSRTVHTYISYPGEAKVRMQQPPNYYGWNNAYYNAYDLITMAFPDFTPRIVNPREGEVVIGHFLTSQNSYWYFQPQQEQADKKSMPLSVIDIYGTQHDFRLGMVAANNYLTLDKI